LKNQSSLIDFILKEWLLISSGVGLLLTSIYAKHTPHYSIQELQVLFILLALFVTVNGLKRSGFILKVTQTIEQGKAIPLKLVITTFFLSMVITNDVALIVIVPLTLVLNITRKDILVIMEALAANAGSALTPFGNPQNLYIYWFYGLHPTEFLTTIAPFSITFLFLLTVSALFIKTNNELNIVAVSQPVDKFAYFYGIMLVILLLTVIHLLPILTGLMVIIFALLFDRKTLRIDYSLLFSFFFFFGFAGNLSVLLKSEMGNAGHIFVFSALASQIMSNVPATMLFAKFTSNWKALLWGTNVGGFGSLFGSFANLIAYKIYITHENKNNIALFIGKFLVLGYAAFFLSIALYFILYRMQGL